MRLATIDYMQVRLIVMICVVLGNEIYIVADDQV